MKKHFLSAMCVCGLAGFTSVATGQEFKPGQTVEDNRLITPGSNQQQSGTVQPSTVQPATVQPGTVQGQVIQPNTTQVVPGTRVVQQPTTGGQNQHQQGQANSQQHDKEKFQAIVVKKLILGNEGEIELAKMAQERAEDSKVKEFAKMMIDSHGKMVEKLKAVKHDDKSQSQATNNSSSQAGKQNRTGQNQQPNQAQQAGQSQSGQDKWSDDSNSTASMLASVMKEACENHLEMTKEMLGEHKASDFDMAYIGQQIVAHNAMLAELKALSDKGDQELNQLISKATDETKQHLDKAKSIAKDLKGDS